MHGALIGIYFPKGRKKEHMRVCRFLIIVCTSLQAQVSLPPAAAVKVDFDKDIRPLLAEKCYSCHGSKVQQSGLRLDKRQNALRGGDYGPVIIQGKSAESKFIKRIVNGDGGMQMPPTGALDKETIGLFRAWIDQGADFGKTEVKEEAPRPPADPKLVSLISAVRGRDAASAEKMVKANPALVKLQDQAGSTALHHAAGFGSLDTIKNLIAAGADVNAKNNRQSTPLHWALASEDKVKLLLAKGADVNARQADGRTPLYHAVSQNNHIAISKLLLDKGADPNVGTANNNTCLMVAAGRGDVATMKLLVEHKADVKAVNGAGSTALIAAGLGRNPEVIRFLLANGLDANTANKRKITPLANAAMDGPDESVKLLLDHGAKVNVQDDRGYSPLMYSAYAERMSPGTVKMLLDKNADASATGEDETAKTLAAKRGDTEVAKLLGVPEAERKRGGIPMMPRSSEDRSIPESVTKALGLLEKQSHNFIRIGGCISCHNQNLPSAALALAKERGIPGPKIIPILSREIREISAERTMDLGLVSINSAGYEMFDLGMNHAPKDEFTDAAVRYFKVMQHPDGSWTTTGNRPPITSDHIQTTAFGIFAVKQFAQDVDKAETAKVLARAVAWLEKAKAETTQQRASLVMGLAWGNAGTVAVERAMKQLIATQREDGGWNQLPGMGSDAYATGMALVALRMTGKMPADDATYQKGLRYLLRTQAADGSWHVKTRSLPTQPYFESGFPYGHDQWISAAGTSWASMALSLSVERKQISQR